ncbi:carboxypeptidase-like regulatory domain-containing protein [Ekhidna sp.]|uniref:TonB-dependent receptor n=1 Tax=Ekhidna sp. TaxID=2608089 RepID=UPI003BAB8043
MKRTVWIYVFLLASQLLFSQSISGKIVDAESSEPLIGAHVYLMNNWRKGAITDIEGAFTIELTGNDSNDSLIVSYVGFREVVVPVSDDLIVALEAIQVEGETVVVTAKPLIAEEFKYMEIKKIDIYTNPAAKADPLLAVNSLPSSTTTDESANISLRGSSPIETGIFFNNVPIYDGVRYSQLNGIGTFSIFSTAIIKSVTVFPGNPPLEFGNATSGIISMQSDDRILGDNTNSLVISLANIGFSREQRINENQSLKIFSNWQPSGPIKLVNEEALEEIKSFTSNDFGVYWYGSTEKINWKLLSYSVTEGYLFNFKHPSFEGIFDQSKRRSFLISSVEIPWGKGTVSINNGLSYSVGNYAYSNVAFRVKKKDIFGGLNYLISNQKYSLKSGLSYDYRNSVVNGNFHEVFYALGPDHPTISFKESADVKVFDLYGYFKYFLSNKVTLGTGLRKNIPLDDSRSCLSSQANMSFTENTWTITVGTGVYHKRGLYENTGEPFEAKNEQKSIDIKREKGGLEISLSLFDKRGEINSVKYTAKGAELFTNYRFNSKLRASASITLLDAENDSENNFAYDLSYFFRGNLSYSPGRMWTIESTLVAREGTTYSEITSTRFDTELNVYEPLYVSETNRLSAYSNIGLSISKIFAVSDEMNIIAFASLNNVFDSENLRGYSYNFDYSERGNNLYSRRTGYMGVLINF